MKAVGAARARDAVRLFMVPGMGHCPVAPQGQDGVIFDPLPVLEAWKEKGVTPDVITVTRRTGNTLTPFPVHHTLHAAN